MKIIVALAALAACGSSPAVPPDATALDAADAPGIGLMVTPTMQDFGNVAVTRTSVEVTFMVTTDSTTSVLTASLAGTNPGDFMIAADACTGRFLQPGASCAIRAAMRPTTIGTKSARLEISGAPGGTATVPLHGTGITVEFMDITPAATAFGIVTVGSTSVTRRLTVHNVGGITLGPLTTTLHGANANEFVIAVDACDGAFLAAGAECVIDTVFRPLSSGVMVAYVRVAALSASVDAVLSGTGGAGEHNTLNPTFHDYGDIATGASSAPRVFTLMNVGGLPHGPATVALGGADANQFAIVDDQCTGQTIAPLAACTVQVAFMPTTPGAKSALLSTIATMTLDASLAGTGVAP